MIDFSLAEDEELFVHTAASFAIGVLRETGRAVEAAGAVGDEVVEEFAHAGLDHLFVAETEIDRVARARVIEELGAGDSATAFALVLPHVAAELARILGVPGARAGLCRRHDAGQAI